MPPTSTATAGTPSAPASSPTRPNGSGQTLGMATTDAPRSSGHRSAPFFHPVNVHGSARLAASASHSVRRGPSPTIVKRIARPRRVAA